MARAAGKPATAAAALQSPRTQSISPCLSDTAAGGSVCAAHEGMNAWGEETIEPFVRSIQPFETKGNTRLVHRHHQHVRRADAQQREANHHGENHAHLHQRALRKLRPLLVGQIAAGAQQYQTEHRRQGVQHDADPAPHAEARLQREAAQPVGGRHGQSHDVAGSESGAEFAGDEKQRFLLLLGGDAAGRRLDGSEENVRLRSG